MMYRAYAKFLGSTVMKAILHWWEKVREYFPEEMIFEFILEG